MNPHLRNIKQEAREVFWLNLKYCVAKTFLDGTFSNFLEIYNIFVGVVSEAPVGLGRMMEVITRAKPGYRRNYVCHMVGFLRK